MRRALTVLLLVLALPLAAKAQTTTFTAGTACNSEISVSGGGLTLGAPVNNAQINIFCIGDTAKYTGLWYYEFTINTVATGGAVSGVGVANNGASQPVIGGTALSIPYTTNPASANFAMDNFSSTGSNIGWDGVGSYSAGAAVAGQTGAVAIDLNTDPPQIWITQNVAATNGYGGGPEWNGSTTASPEVAGTGIPTTGGTGLNFILPGQGYFPVFQDEIGWNNTPGEVTFNFGASAFVGTVPTGYSAWNTVGGGPPTPGPTNPMTINVANAPGWQASTTYVQGDRVVAGPAWNGSAYTSGQKLYLWALTGGFGGASGTSATAFDACASPANYGGGLLGNHPTQWLNATHVTDGALTWTCLTPVDYTTFTAMAVDSATTWAPSTQYHPWDYILDGENAYEDAPGGTNPCTSAATGSGPTPSNGADNTCSWNFVGTVPYSSEENRLPHQTTYSTGLTEINMEWNTVIDVWYGGRAAPVYQDNAGGETDPILMANHSDEVGEYTPYCYHGDTGLNYVQMGGCGAPGWYTTIQPAPGDGFANNMIPGVTPFGYPNSAYGVTFYSDSAFANAPPFPGSAMAVSDALQNWFGLQFLSTQGPALDGANTGATTMGNPGNGHPDSDYFNGDIFYAGGSLGVLTTDGGSVLSNSTIIYNGTAADCFGVWSKFNLPVTNTTMIGPGAAATNCTAIMDFGGSAAGSAPAAYYNDAIFGWANPWSYSNEVTPSSPTLPSTVGSNNATDLASSYTGASAVWTPSGATFQAAMLPGMSLYSLSASAQFVDSTPGPSVNLTLLPSGSLYGGGATFSYSDGRVPNGTLTPGSDIFGNARPQGTRYDIGAYEVSLGCPSPLGTGCR